MELTTGSCRFGLWFVHAAWKDDCVYRVRFAREGIDGPVPEILKRYCAGQDIDPARRRSTATEGDTVYAAIYRAVQQVPYGTTATYGTIAGRVGTGPRVVGTAMARNPTPLVIPCHRIVAKSGLGGFSPDISIKEELIALERKNRKLSAAEKGRT